MRVPRCKILEVIKNVWQRSTMLVKLTLPLPLSWLYHSFHLGNALVRNLKLSRISNIKSGRSQTTATNPRSHLLGSADVQRLLQGNLSGGSNLPPCKSCQSSTCRPCPGNSRLQNDTLAGQPKTAVGCVSTIGYTIQRSRNPC